MRAVTVGSATIDIIVMVPNDQIERMTMHNATSSFLLLEQGRKVDAHGISSHIGGGAVNTAIALERLGFDTEILVKLGRDLNADKVSQALSQEGVRLDRVLRTADAGTGVSVMITSHDHNVSIFTCRGANTQIRLADLQNQDFSGFDLVYISNLSEGSRDCFVEFTKRARASNATLAVNPGILQISKAPTPLLESLSRIDILTINRAEAAALLPALLSFFSENSGAPTKTARPDDAPPSLGQDLSYGSLQWPLIDFLQAIQSLGPRYAVITDGAAGAYVATENAIHFCPSLKREVASTAGAGDAFAATLSGSLALGKDLDFSMQAATVNAAAVVAQVNTTDGLLSLSQLDQELKLHSKKLPIAALPLGL